jgi:hypothetical protein
LSPEIIKLEAIPKQPRGNGPDAKVSFRLAAMTFLKTLWRGDGTIRMMKAEPR